MLIEDLKQKGLISPPHDILHGNTQYLCYMGSIAYGVSDLTSDIDIYGWCIPKKEVIFPHLIGQINGFGRQIKKFEQYQQHHIKDINNKKEYDLTIYNIVKYFQLCMENNPNIIDSLFVPRRCIIHSTKIAEMVREKRNIFLHKGAWFKFKGYSFSQMHKLKIKKPQGTRKESIKKYGYDIKFAYHIVRLLNEIEQILIEHDLDLERNKEQLKAIRRGEWTKEQVINYFTSKEKSLEIVYANSTLQYSPNEKEIKQLLFNCLEEHYGNLSIIPKIDVYQKAIKEILETLNKYNIY